MAYKDPRVPWYAKALIALVIGYALCPLDLIPDFIPVLGYIDDIIIVPAGISLALRMIPPDVLEECRRKAKQQPVGTMKYLIAAVVVVLWLLATYAILRISLNIVS